MSLEDLSAELKISEENLQAIEAGDPKALPSEPYYNLFAKSYSQYLGIDFTATMDAIKEEIGERESLEELHEAGNAEANRKESDKKSKEKSAESGPGKKLMIIAGAVVVVFVVFIVSYKLFFEKSGGDASEEHVEAGATEAVHEDAGTEADVDAEYANYNWAEAENIATDSLHLTLTAREESWATVMADGDTVLYQNLAPWREYPIDARYRLMVSIGVPRLVEIKLNGKPAYLADAESGRISRVEVNQVNWQSFMEPQRPKTVRQEASQSASTPSTAPTVNTNASQQNQTSATPRREPAVTQPAATPPAETTQTGTSETGSTQTGTSDIQTQGAPQRPVDTTRIDTARPVPVDTAGQVEDEASRPQNDRSSSPYSGTRRTQPETADNGGGTL